MNQRTSYAQILNKMWKILVKEVNQMKKFMSFVRHTTMFFHADGEEFEIYMEKDVFRKY